MNRALKLALLFVNGVVLVQFIIVIFGAIYYKNLAAGLIGLAGTAISALGFFGTLWENSEMLVFYVVMIVMFFFWEGFVK